MVCYCSTNIVEQGSGVNEADCIVFNGSLYLLYDTLFNDGRTIQKIIVICQNERSHAYTSQLYH